MKERPINMRADEVRAILAGRKTQFRRVFKFCETNQPPACPDKFNPKAVTEPCPFGQPGDRLWVRETFRLFDCQTECACYDSCSCSSHHGKPVFRATHPDNEGPWIPSVHMPRKFSRITLEIVSVRVERLQDINEEDAKAEGVIETFRPAIDPMGLANNYYVEFARLWKSINGPEDWDKNPWVRVVEFRGLEGAQ